MSATLFKVVYELVSIRQIPKPASQVRATKFKGFLYWLAELVRGRIPRKRTKYWKPRNTTVTTERFLLRAVAVFGRR